MNLLLFVFEEDYQWKKTIEAINVSTMTANSCKEIHTTMTKLSSGFVDDLSLLYDSLSAERKALVTPYIPSDESFKTTWETCQYNQNKRHPVSRNFPTKRGEYVRSKSEILIANALFDHNIPYRYEAELVLDSKKIYPDFTILNQRTRKILYWEHFGMLENPEYARECSYKLSLFETSGLHLGSDIIITIESRTAPLTLDLINKMIEGYLI